MNRSHLHTRSSIVARSTGGARSAAVPARPQSSVTWCGVMLLLVALGASLVGLGSSDPEANSIVNTLFYVFVGLFAVSFFFVLRGPRA